MTSTATISATPRLILEAASLCTETRGGRVRTDYPDQESLANGSPCFAE